MRYLDTYDNVSGMFEQADIDKVLFPYELKEWTALSNKIKTQKIRRLCSVPLCNEDFTVVYSLYMRLKWIAAFKACINTDAAGRGAVVLEVGSGSSVNIPNALTVFDSSYKYITANMNKKLTEGLRKNTASLPIKIEIIEDDANNIKKYLSPGSVDAIVFEHSVNDILQAILCERNGIDTTNSDWFEILPEMIKLISDKYVEQKLEMYVKNIFLSLLKNCISVLKPGGHLIMSHYMYQYDLDLGYNQELWENIIPLVRPWLNELQSGCEVFIDSFDPQWWSFYQKQ
ncbi:MAG: hypothetical protein LBD23_02505 [Oscillospiraceae bacterium]|nr:hypothetical protein [Oscillospiraceae bacterium]